MRGLKTILVIAISGIAPLFADLQITNNSNLQLFPKVVQASGGNFVCTWCDNRQSGGHFEIRSNATNSLVSSIVGGSDVDLSRGSDGHRLHAEMVESNDGAMVAWVDHNTQKVWTIRVDQNGDIDGYFEGDDGDGKPRYVHDAAFMTPPQMCSDGAGGAILT